MKARVRSRGFTLVELMVAVTIALFLMGGLITLVFAMRRTSTIQTGLSQLQDNERLSLALIGDVIQSAGYFPIEPSNWVAGGTVPFNTPGGEFGALGVFTASGQVVVGTGTAATTAPFDTISVRYVTSGSDGMLNCSGSTNSVAGTVINQFQIAVVNGTSYLQCVLTAAGATTTINMVPGVTNMQVYYGVETTTTTGFDSIDTYLPATGTTSVTSGGYWSNVASVKVVLTFVNPLYCAGSGCLPGQTATATPTVQFSTTVDVMNHTGVT